MSNPKTLNQLISWAVSELEQSSDTAKLDAKILLRHLTNYSGVDLILKADQILSEDVTKPYREIIFRRQQGIPIAYLTGQKEFWSLNFKVTDDTLIPRTETELLVETALTLIPQDSELTIADLGTGSGAIACAIASERPQVNILATDQSVAALKVAKENANSLKLANIKFIQSNWFENLTDLQFDLIVSNPPYVSAEDENLSEGDVRFEPDTALTPGADGLKSLNVIIEQSKSHLKTGGYLLVEHGYDQQKAVRELFLNTQKSEKTVIPAKQRNPELRSGTGIHSADKNMFSKSFYKNIVCLRDLNNQPRVTYAQAI